MKKFLAVAVIVAVGITVFGCGKKQEAQEPMTMEALNTINAPAAVPPEAKATAEVPAQATAPALVQQVEPLSVVPSIPAKPSAMDIQTALKNAGYYSGSIDGKIGLKSTKAIEDFQKANGLTVDGKVGPKTWAALSKYLTAQVTSGQAQ